MSTEQAVKELIERSNRLGSDAANTNYGGGNTSAKGSVTDPATGDEVEVMWVKGSGGDLGTLTPAGLSMLRLDRLRALQGVYRGVEHEDEMHQLLDFCGMGPIGAAPSIDTSMHALLPPAHVDHLHPDSVIAIAAAADGEELTKRCFGDEVAWVPWRRPGFELAEEVAGLHQNQPHLKGVVLGGHGLTTWGDTSESCEAASLDLIKRAAEFLEHEGRPEPLGQIRPGFDPLEPGERYRQAVDARAADSGDGGERGTGHRPMVRRRSGARLHRARGRPPSGAARHLVPGSFHPHQGAATAPRPTTGRSHRGPHLPAPGAPRRVPSRVRGVLPPPRRRGHPTDARRRPGHLPDSRGRHVQLWSPTARPPALPASSTSTPST